MKEVNYVFGGLEEPDVEALMHIGTQQQMHVSDQLLTEGTLYLVLDGELSVSVKGRNAAIAYVGKGEIVGEMSLLESQPASATLCAITPVTVANLHAKMPCNGSNKRCRLLSGWSCESA
jgi:CRP/FNR family transcriptional regulator, cyclic AMP receptor protein